MPLDNFKKMLEKKKGLSDVEKDAKMNVVKDLRDSASSMMKDKLGGLKKVTVASDSKEGLEEGLDKAEELLEGEDKEKTSEMEVPSEDMGLDAINKHLELLMELKRKLEAKKQ